MYDVLLAVECCLSMSILQWNQFCEGPSLGLEIGVHYHMLPLLPIYA
jgi:hypothetical protein